MSLDNIRKLNGEERFDEALLELELLIKTSPECAHLWVLRGILIQLSDISTLTLEDAEQSFLKALEIEPDFIEALEDLTHFYYAVMDDKEKTRAILNRLDESLSRVSAGVQEIREWLNTEP